MFIKLAIFNDKKIEKITHECCCLHDATYIPLIDNYFGILTENKDIIYGREDGEYKDELNIKTFVDVYNCVKNKSRHSILPFKKTTPYSGKLLDNLFFYNIIRSSLAKGVELESVRFITEYGTDDSLYEYDEIMKLIESSQRIRIIKLMLKFNNEDIIFNKKGYVEICSNLSFYKNHQDTLIDLIKTGLEDFNG